MSIAGEDSLCIDSSSVFILGENDLCIDSCSDPFSPPSNTGARGTLTVVVSVSLWASSISSVEPGAFSGLAATATSISVSTVGEDGLCIDTGSVFVAGEDGLWVTSVATVGPGASSGIATATVSISVCNVREDGLCIDSC
uniref:Uncharacterized protein n=1 Tax=Leersia perrieri TaxID=77586 RepID=A0A0D9V2U8_9ORYZ